ncbi:zinc ribbon domain-containing protein [Streptomyces sp. CB01635]|uniref:zinc ribbon domain-containing protein n=1 Tax=unclassified Streptomyces TaxID=2593676 RepID=UPI002D78E58E|nr:zinc ribbon domain-containing protein [Streptomyces sp. CB01635]
MWGEHCWSPSYFAASCGGAEELQGIRQRVRLRKHQRVTLHSCAFAQFGDFIVYKTHRADVPVVYVDPAYTSQQCCECGLNPSPRPSPTGVTPDPLSSGSALEPEPPRS